MTNAELNRDIKRLNKKILKRLKQKEEEKCRIDIFKEFEKEYRRLYCSDKTFKVLNKTSILIMLKLQLKYQFVPVHRFGLFIDLEKL